MTTTNTNSNPKMQGPPTHYLPPTPPPTPPRHGRPGQSAALPAPPPPLPSHQSRPPQRRTRLPKQPPQPFTQSQPQPRLQQPLQDALPVELYARLEQQSREALTISKFASLVAKLNDGRNRNPTVRAALITDFSFKYAAGKLTSTGKPFNRPKYATRAARDKLAGYPTGRGILAELTIKNRLSEEGVLLAHKDRQDLSEIVRTAMSLASELGRVVYVDCGLVQSPSFGSEYRGWGWAAPGVRWNSFIPDLIAVGPRQGGGWTFEVIEIKYSGREELTVWPNYKVQAIFCKVPSPHPRQMRSPPPDPPSPPRADHLALTKLLSHVPRLHPSHQVSIWHSRDYHSPEPIVSTLALRTNRAFVEELLFNVLPTWLGAVTATELRAGGAVHVGVSKPEDVGQVSRERGRFPHGVARANANGRRRRKLAPPSQLAIPASLKPGGPAAPYTAYIAPVPSPPHTPPRLVCGPRVPRPISSGRPQAPSQATAPPSPRRQARSVERPATTPPAGKPEVTKKTKGPFGRAWSKIKKAFCHCA